MKTTLTLAVAVAVSLGTLSVLEWNSYRDLPAGEVTIVQLEAGQNGEPARVAPVAQAERDGRARTASSL